MTVFGLQLTAMITMLCDHLGNSFLDNSVLLRSIGRIAFPTYAFLLAEGFRHMKNNPKKLETHLAGLVVLAFVSEFCYDLLEADEFTVAGLVAAQSAIITLLLAFLGMMAIERWKDKPLWMWSTIGLTALANYFISSNFRFAGVLLTYAFYYYLEHMEGTNYFQRLLRMAVIFVIYLPIYHWARYDFGSMQTFMENLTFSNQCWYAAHFAAAAILASYTGKLGFYSKPFKKVYRNFYPGHLFVLGIIKLIFFR